MTLTAIIDGTRDALQADAGNGKVSFNVSQELVGVTEVHGTAGSGHRIVVDEPPALGGTNAAANPVEYALAALGSCQVITYRVWATHLGIKFDSISVEVEGDLDLRGFFGVDPTIRPGYEQVRITLHITGPETPARYEELRRAVDEHCPVLDLFSNQTPVKIDLRVG
jgi:hypothetical protein